MKLKVFGFIILYVACAVLRSASGAAAAEEGTSVAEVDVPVSPAATVMAEVGSGDVGERVTPPGPYQSVKILAEEGARRAVLTCSTRNATDDVQVHWYKSDETGSMKEMIRFQYDDHLAFQIESQGQEVCHNHVCYVCTAGCVSRLVVRDVRLTDDAMYECLVYYARSNYTRHFYYLDVVARKKGQEDIDGGAGALVPLAAGVLVPLAAAAAAGLLARTA